MSFLVRVRVSVSLSRASGAIQPPEEWPKTKQPLSWAKFSTTMRNSSTKVEKLHGARSR